MTVLLTHNAYGKSRVRLTKVERHADRHDLFEWSVDVQLEGDFVPAYTVGDNRNVVATDTMKNTVYAVAADAPLGSPEAFGLLLGKHFLKYPQVRRATITITVDGWQHIEIAGKQHPHAFVGSGAEKRTCVVAVDRSDETITSGLTDLLVLKTTDSAWKDFHRDEYRTLPDAEDRILATSVTAEWSYSTAVDGNVAHAMVRRAMIESFAGHKSLGAQHTIHIMGEAVLAAVSDVNEITLTLPNRHRIPMNLIPLGRENTSSIYIATDEPHGLISGTLRRG